MAAGFPLSDEDRWDWLVLLRKKAVERLSETDAPGVVLTCSALKHKYRDVIRIAAYNDHNLIVHFIYLHADEPTLMQRVRARKGHYMKEKMVHSQFATLEEPEEDERDCLSVDACASAAQVQRETLHLVQETLEADS
jgi:gluconokinase